jgi:hypothetical protein
MVYVLNHKGSPLEQKLTAIQNEVFVLDYCRPWLGLCYFVSRTKLYNPIPKKRRAVKRLT